MKKLLFAISLFSAGCFQANDVSKLYQTWIGKEVLYPYNSTFTIMGCDTVCSYPRNCSLKILNYIDSVGCLSCKSQLSLWNDFIDDVHIQITESLPIHIFMHPRHLGDAIYTIRRDSFPFPVCIDLADSLNKLNHFPTDVRFRCFLLDENNKVILIGNPVQDPKIKDLYLRTIAEKLGLEYNQEANLVKDNRNEINLGTFSQSESKTTDFIISNNTKSVMQIDSIFTSCECTTATIDNTIINPSGSANLTVSYTPDGVGEFYREVYVQIKGEERPRIYNIRGNVE